MSVSFAGANHCTWFLTAHAPNTSHQRLSTTVAQGKSGGILRVQAGSAKMTAVQYVECDVSGGVLGQCQATNKPGHKIILSPRPRRVERANHSLGW